MNSQKSKNSPKVLSALARGLLMGLAFFIPGLLFITNIITPDLQFNQSVTLPILTDLTQDFRTGIGLAEDYFSKKADDFYDLEEQVSIHDIEESPQSIEEQDIAWEKTSLSRKLKQLDTLKMTNPKPAPLKPKEDPIISNNTKALSYAVWSKDTIRQKLVAKLGKKKLASIDNYLKYIEKHKDLASKEMYYNKIPASVTLAQGLLESNAGKSFLARKCNNHFGIKCKPKRGFRKDGKITHGDFVHNPLAYNCKQLKDDNLWDRFEMYESTEISYHRHSDLLTKNSRYNWMIKKYKTGKNYQVEKEWFGKEKVPYYAAWTIGLKKSGYATNKRYAQQLAFIIETYELWRIDYSVIFWS